MPTERLITALFFKLLTLQGDNSMTRFPQTNFPASLNRYIALSTFKQMPTGNRLDLDHNTYVLRENNRYVVYRTWMSIVHLVEVFEPGSEPAIIQWLEQFGYSFE